MKAAASLPTFDGSEPNERLPRKPPGASVSVTGARSTSMPAARSAAAVALASARVCADAEPAELARRLLGRAPR